MALLGRQRFWAVPKLGLKPHDFWVWIFDYAQLHGYCESVKNLTLSLDDTIYHAARVEAAKRRTSVSAVVRAYLQSFAQGKIPAESAVERDRKERAKMARLFRQANLVLGYKPSREKSHER
jgi:hypothetical protein